MNLYNFHSNPESLYGADKARTMFPEMALEHARKIGKRFPEGEKAILRGVDNALIQADMDIAYIYAKTVIKGRWPEFEKRLITKIIDKHYHGAGLAYTYARDVVKGRWPEGEEAIFTAPEYGHMYIHDIAKGQRVPAFEKNIIDNQEFGHVPAYAEKTIKGRWPEGEKLLLKACADDDGNKRNRAANSAVYYARDVIKGRWPEFEKTKAYQEAGEFIKGPYNNLFKKQ